MRRKNIKPAQRVEVLKLLQSLEPKDVAARTGLSLSTVYKIRRKSRATLVQWRQQRHEQLLLAALHDLEGIALFPARDPDLQTWLARPNERRWPIPKGYVWQDEHGALSVRLVAEDQPEWQCLRQHLKARPLWKLLDEWRAACAADLTHRRALYREIAKCAQTATGMRVISDLVISHAKSGLDHYYVYTIYDQVFSRVAGMPLAAKRRKEFTLHGGKVNLGARLIVVAATTKKAGAAVRFLLEAQRSLADIPQATAAVEAYKCLVEATNGLKQELGQIRIMGSLPANTRCDNCP